MTSLQVSIFIISLLIPALLAGIKIDNLNGTVDSQEALREVQKTKAEECAMKASLLANIVDPRHYTETGTERVYRDCLNQ